MRRWRCWRASKRGRCVWPSAGGTRRPGAGPRACPRTAGAAPRSPDRRRRPACGRTRRAPGPAGARRGAPGARYPPARGRSSPHRSCSGGRAGGERAGIALPAEDRPDDRQAGHPGDVADDVGQLQVHLLEGLLHVLNMVGGVGHEHRALAEIAAQHADLVIGPEGGGQQAKGVELLDPLAVEDVGLAARHALQLPRVDESDLEAALAEELEEGDPVHAGGLHRHGLDVAAGEPVGQGVQIRGEGPELADVAPLGVAAVRDGDVVTPGADIDARGVQVDPAEFGWERGRAATAVRLRMGARHGGLLASGHRRGHVGRGGAAVRILPNGITPQGQAVTNDIGALLRDHAMKRAPRTTEGTVFSTRHVRVDRTRSQQPEQRYFLLSGRGAAYDCSEVADPVKSLLLSFLRLLWGGRWSRISRGSSSFYSRSSWRARLTGA